ncbi:MAG: sulfotransferase domain-containing protein [Acidocella sp.]|nr:sulfotransferase domain-containing protein [Acidocella sp.]
MGKLVWLASYPKSGNTWLRAFLHNFIAEPETPYSINALTDFSAVESAAVFFAPYDPRPASRYSTIDVQRLRPRVHADLMALHEDLVFIKTHNAALKIHDIELCTPEVSAGAIYLLRDPRDVAVSYARYTGQSIDQTITFMGKSGAANRGTETQVFEFLSSWSAHVRSWAMRPKTLVVRYEDLLSAPETAFGAIISYLGDAPETQRLRKAIAFSRFEVLAGQEGVGGYAAHAPGAASAFFRAGQAGGWREILSPAQARQIATDHAAVMQQFGYLG